uniref:SMP-LTD domain-containing protein n=1 Tax=Oncorhynchus tshawytscha TaxID=74940 RepID=A0A8C8EIA8_ONCTS
MAEIGENVARGREEGDDGVGGLRPPHDPESPAHFPFSAPPVRAHHVGLRRGIVIQLTGTEGEWDSLDDNELIFPLEHNDYDDQTPYISLSKERQNSMEEENQHCLHSPAFHVPLSPSSPGSLGDCSNSAPSFLSPSPATPTHRPLASLVKSLSTELELPHGSSLRPRPFLSLVKSISTEISRSEPEVSQSKSDSRLNLHLQWKNLTQPKGRSDGDSRTAPPSPIALSPSESTKAGFFKMELEDTKRKFSEAMQEPMFSKPISIFSKIMGDEKENAAAGSPKHQRATGTHSAGSPSSRGVYVGRMESTEVGITESPLRSAKRTDGDSPPVFDWPCVKHPKKGLPTRTCSVHDHHGNKPNDNSEELEICTYDEVMQVVAIESHHHRCPRRLPGSLISSGPHRVVVQPTSPPPPPHMVLFCVAVLSYAYFILPLGPYISGLALGMAFGFLLGLLLIRLGSTRHTAQPHPHRDVQALTEVVKQGWLNEMFEYDPETYHLSLTHSVFASLEGHCLRLDYPRNNISRRATYDEKPPEAAVVSTRCFQLRHSKVFLLPSELARKRLWNLKYPICIELAEGEGVMEEGRGTVETPREEQGGDPQLQTRPTSNPKPAAKLPTTLYLFGRTGREKEEWFHHFLSASMVMEKEKENERPGRSVISDSRGSSRIGSTEEDLPVPPSAPSIQPSRVDSPLLDYPTYMARFLPSEQPSPLPKFPVEDNTDWVNALIGRIFWDFLREKYWADIVSRKIQKKLSKIRLPYFMNELTLTELDMGSCLPQITSASRPVVNSRGLWLELEVVYTGALQMTLETKINLKPVLLCFVSRSRPVLSVLADSDEESSSAGSSDEEEVLLSEHQSIVGEKGTLPGAEGTGRRILRFVDKIAKSKYFQKATENEYIKKKIEEMSNTPLLLAVEVQELSGTLAVNIPPPPTDRIWYSFCVPPKLDLHVRPKLGEREVTFCHVTEWIEKKLQDEFEKVFVLPNMDDIYLPLMHSGMDSPPAGLLEECPAQSSHSQHSSMESIERISQDNTAADLDLDYTEQKYELNM